MKREERMAIATAIRQEKRQEMKAIPERPATCRAVQTALDKRALLRYYPGAVLVREMCRRMREEGTFAPSARMFAWLREKGFLLSEPDTFNAPSDESIRNGWMVAARSSSAGNGTKYVTPYVTPKGYDHFKELIKREGGLI